MVKDKTIYTCNDAARAFTLHAPGASGVPEVWDAMRGEVCSVPRRDEAGGVSFDLTLEGGESALVRFAVRDAGRPARLTAASKPAATFSVLPDPSAVPAVYLAAPDKALTVSPCAGAAFQGIATIPQDALAGGRRVYLVCDMARGNKSNDTQRAFKAAHAARGGDSATLRQEVETAAAVRVNGAYAGGFIGRPCRVNITRHLKPGRNTVHIEPFRVDNVRVEVH